jgi:hypothetical protein
MTCVVRNQEKQGLDPRSLHASKVFVDLPGQSATMGNLHRDLGQGLMMMMHVEVTRNLER